MTVEKRKGIDLLSKVALTEEAQYEEVHKKSLRDFHKTHPSGSGIVTKIAPSAAKIKHSVTNKRTGAKPGVPDVTKKELTESEAESWGRDKDDNNNDHDSRSEDNDQESNSEENEEEVEDDEEEKDDEFVKTPSNSTDDEDETNEESKVEDKTKGDEYKGMDFSTNQFADDVDVRLNEPVNTDEGFIQKEGTDVEMVNVQVTTLEKEVVELKKDDLLNTQVTALIDEHLDSRLGATRDEFMSYLWESITARITEQKRKPSKDAEPIKGSKAKESQSGLSKGTKSQSKSSGKSVHTEEPEVANSNMLQDQEENQGNDDEEPKRKAASKRDWFTKSKQPEEPIDPD
ncbi:hypothetical protein Tco_0991716 [Tanacetum coccineum]|uniref:Uncharacterized protein n=1 Tax=Tanacetum coccineum TaxID=301880 RepID=A0ABQ5F1I4_9ASTR